MRLEEKKGEKEIHTDMFSMLFSNLNGQLKNLGTSKVPNRMKTNKKTHRFSLPDMNEPWKITQKVVPYMEDYTNNDCLELNKECLHAQLFHVAYKYIAR
ncbi:hypothetical protein ACJX0J_028077 [Zea mays]